MIQASEFNNKKSNTYMEGIVNDIKNKVLNSTLEFYSNLCREIKVPKRLKFKGNPEDIWDVNDYILDILDYLDTKYGNSSSEVPNCCMEDNLEEIIKSINSDIVFKYKKTERLDWENEYETVNTIVSYHKSNNNCFNSELCFLQYTGYMEAPGEIIRFLIRTILADLLDTI
jgi:hypothetical protein